MCVCVCVCVCVCYSEICDVCVSAREMKREREGESVSLFLRAKSIKRGRERVYCMARCDGKASVYD